MGFTAAPDRCTPLLAMPMVNRSFSQALPLKVARLSPSNAGRSAATYRDTALIRRHEFCSKLRRARHCQTGTVQFFVKRRWKSAAPVAELLEVSAGMTLAPPTG